MKPTLWIVSELFYPDQTSTSYILGEIAKKMQEKYEVKVLSGPKVYDEGKVVSGINDDQLEEIEISRVWTPKLSKNISIQRIIRFLWISLGLFFKAIIKMKHKDRVLLVTNPVPLIVLMSWLKKIKSLSVILLVHDVFPENTIPTNLISSIDKKRYKFLCWIFNTAYSAFDEFIVLGQDMKSKVEKKITASKYIAKKKFYVIENWGDIENIRCKTRKESNLPHDKIILNYAGNIGRGQGLLEFVKLLSKVKNENLIFHIYGSGALEKQIKKFILKERLEDKVMLLGPYTREQQNDILNSCDFALVSLGEGMCGLGVPSKTYNILAAGKPILYLGDKNSEIDLLVRKEGIGFSFVKTDEESIIEFLETLDLSKLDDYLPLGEKARTIAEEKYSKDKILNRFYLVI